MKQILGPILLLFSLSVHAQNKWSLSAETAVTFDNYFVDDGSNIYGPSGGGPYLFNTGSTGFLLGLTARYKIKKPFFVESGIYLKNDDVKMIMKSIGKRSVGKHNTWLIPIRLGAILPMGTSKFHFTPTAGLSLGLSGAKKGLTGDFRQEPYTGAASQRITFLDYPVESNGLSLFTEAGLGGSYQLSEKLAFGLQTRILIRAFGDAEHSGHYNAGGGDGYIFLATQKKKQVITVGLTLNYQL